jgi:colanic acid/amylovoran biosynthesis protein
VNGIMPDHFDQAANKFCIIPNYRMIDKTSHEISCNYVSFMAKCAVYLVKKNILPFILIHEGKNDRYVADMIIDQTGMAIPVIQESDAINIKGIIGNCEGAIGSRYHGLVSALSQGVPSLATSWGHKYQKLFDEYSFPDGVLNITDNFNAAQKKIDLITEVDTKNIIRNKIMIASGKLKQQSEAMWNDVFSIIDT